MHEDGTKLPPTGSGSGAVMGVPVEHPDRNASIFVCFASSDLSMPALLFLHCEAQQSIQATSANFSMLAVA